MIAREGIPFILPAWVASLLFLALYLATQRTGWLILFVPVSILTVFLTSFFRDPERTPPAGENLILSPGDGKIILIEPFVDEQGRKYKLVSMFLSVFDVHINRIPISGTVTSIKYTEGEFRRAFEREAVTENERNEITIESPSGSVKFAQVAGILARRIVCRIKLGEKVTRGERFGMIKFGSRIDLFLTEDVELRVKVGDKVIGGETVIGAFKRDV